MKTHQKEIQICPDPISVGYAESRFPDLFSGATVTFTGTVRVDQKENKVTRLEFEAYEPMALKELERIVELASGKWNLLSIVILHRTGIVMPGEPAVIVTVKTPHRKDAFECCAFVMDELKKTVPIWKKEVFENGESWVSAHP